jgi:signal transduction histidine kinase/DNA-binding response OmpR family regulator
VQQISLTNASSPTENTITCFFEDSKKNIWIGTNHGLYLKPVNSPVKLVSLKIHFINTVVEDSDNRIWIGTEKEGVFVCDRKLKGNQSSYTLSKVNLNISSDKSFSVQSICSNKNGDVYIGTKEGHLYFYDKYKQTASDISGLYGITDVGIMDILEDNYGILWISTIKKIIRFNPLTHVATYYSVADGILISSFFKDSRIKLKSGQILFGGNNGICLFNPSAQTTVTKTTGRQVALTDIHIQNKSIFDDELNTHFNAAKNRLTLKYTENNLGIEFSALDFSSASKIQYAYMLSGIENDWNYIGNNRRFVNYANLPFGKYKFMVKASDENGLWSNEITSLEVVILAPLYRTWWAYLIYLIVLGGIAYFVSKTLVNRIRMRNELKISRIEKEKSEELAQIKLRYFTNISHELLTPLTIIMLLIENLQKKNSGDPTQIEMMKANVIRLKRLIQQILVFRKTESGNMKLKIRQNDIIAFVNNICQSNFQPLINEKEIHFSINAEHESYNAYFDPDKLDKILYNLLSNAFKHTPKGGEISVKMSFVPRNEETILRLSVSDSGEGISDEDLPHIFKRFYISRSSDQSQSHGIGLALTSDLLQIHKGNIEVKSQLGDGAIFTIEIPVSINAFTADELTEEEVPQPVNPLEIPEITPLEDIEKPEENTETQKAFTVLVVEDNPELNNLIVSNFSEKYKVLSAENGLQALEIIRNNEIDLVISDVMMPEMDGLSLCKIIKNDIETSQISVLMLTAKNSSEDRIECYNAGADSYIAKPFELSVLEARTKNLINKRLQKSENFRKNQEINISSMEYGSIDEQFLKQAVKKVEEKLSDEKFDFDQFALDMATSKSTLHRKLKSLTGLSPVEFIRNIRLKHSVQMLANNMGNISDVAFAVGFNDPKYFSRCFKIEFGQTPREYQESKKKQ